MFNSVIMERWRGKTVVVTGASAGIGAAICEALADTGMHVIGLDKIPNFIDVCIYYNDNISRAL